MAEKRDPNLAKIEDLSKKFTKQASVYFQRFLQDRGEIDEVNRVADYMYACAQNRSLLSSEKSKGMNLEKDTRANVGSTIFFRQVNTLASMLVRVCKSRKDLWKYEPIGLSKDDSRARAEQANILARWTRKQSGFDAALPELATHIYKYSNVFAMIYWDQQYKRQKYVTPIYDTEVNEKGETVAVQTGEEYGWRNVVTRSFPCVSFPHIDSIYTDKYISSIQQQNCVIVLSRRNKSDILSDVNLGFFDKSQYEKIKADQEWNGQYGASLKEDEKDNRNQEWNPIGTKTYLQWDIFMRAPIDGKSWDEDNPEELYWCTVIGNSIDNGIVMRIERNPDPDDEIPLKEIRALPDKSDTLYHTTLSEVIRSGYSTDCTLINIALDNMGIVNDPPLKVLDGAHRIKDFTYRSGQRWHVDSLNAVEQMDIRDNTQQIAGLRQMIQNDVMQALATDASMMGQYAGARTSASEYLGVSGNTKNPHMVQIGYIISQLFPWMARKYLSYWSAYSEPAQVMSITDGNKEYNITPRGMAGEFDIEINLVDEYEDDIVKQQQIGFIVQTLASAPHLAKSDTHEINMGKLVKRWLDAMSWDGSEIVGPPSGIDAERVASDENRALLAGAYDRPQQGENHSVHLKIHEGERIRWNGLEDVDDPRAKNLLLLDQHIEEHKQLANSSPVQSQGSPMAQPTESTPGQMMGGEIAGAMGG